MLGGTWHVKIASIFEFKISLRDYIQKSNKLPKHALILTLEHEKPSNEQATAKTKRSEIGSEELPEVTKSSTLPTSPATIIRAWSLIGSKGGCLKMVRFF